MTGILWPMMIIHDSFQGAWPLSEQIHHGVLKSYEIFHESDMSAQFWQKNLKKPWEQWRRPLLKLNFQDFLS